jgi:hypothetical protein
MPQPAISTTGLVTSIKPLQVVIEARIHAGEKGQFSIKCAGRTGRGAGQAKIAATVFQIELRFTVNHADSALRAHIGSQKRPVQGSKNSPSRRSTSS